MHFCYFIIVSPMKKELPFILKNLNPLQECFVQRLVESSPVVLEKIVKIALLYFRYFIECYLPLE